MVALSKTEWEIYHLVRLKPRTGEELRRLIWKGEVRGRTTLYQHIANANRRLRPHGMEIRSTVPGQRYKVIDLGQRRLRERPAWKEFDPAAVWVAG